MDLAVLSQSPIGQEPSKPLILAVECDEDNRVLLSYALELFGYPFIIVADREAAFSLACEARPDLILLEAVLPTLADGLELIRQLKRQEQTRTIPIVAVTAIATPLDRERILASGCDGFLAKPYLLEQLQQILDMQLTE